MCIRDRDNTLSGNPIGTMGSIFQIDADRMDCPIWNNGSDDIFLYDGDSQSGGNLIDMETYDVAGTITYDVPPLNCPIPMVEPFCFTFDDSFCNQTSDGIFYVKAIINPFTEYDDPTTSGNAGDTNDCFGEDMERFELFELKMNCPVAELSEVEVHKCLADIQDSDIFLTIDLDNIVGSYDLVLALDDGNSIHNLSLTEQTTNPLTINYAQLASILGPTFKVTVTIISISNSGMSGCSGRASLVTLPISVIPSPTGIISSATDLTDCSGDANGSVTFEFSPIDSGPWEFEYSINGGPLIASSASISPFVLPVSVAGEYQLINVISVDNCSGAIGASAVQVVNTPSFLSLNSVTDLIACNDGTETIDLNRDIVLDLNDNGTSIMGNANTIGNITWYQADPSLLPIAARNTILLTPTIFIPVAAQDYFFVYKRPSDGCEIIGQTTISLNPSVCCKADAGNIIRPDGGTIDAKTKNQSICLGDDLSGFSNDYDEIDEIAPDNSTYQTAFLLTNNSGTILQVTNNGDFDFTALGVGIYDIFVLNYSTSNTPNSLIAYLSQLNSGSPDGTGGSILEIVKDDKDNSSYGLSTGSMRIVNPSSFGNYCLDLDELDNNGMDATAIKVQVRITPLPVATINDVAICSGITKAALNFQVTSGSPTHYAIDYDAIAKEQGFLDVISSSTLPTDYIIPANATAGIYHGSFIYVDDNGCQGTANFTIEIRPLPTAIVIDSEICENDIAVPIDLSVTTGLPVKYTIDYNNAANNAGFVDITSPTDLTNATFTIPVDISPNSYFGVLTFQDAFGCVGTDEFEINITPLVITEAGIPQTICSTNFLTLANLQGSISGESGTGTWTTNGTGVFDFEGPNNFSTATVYMPSSDDIEIGAVVLTLTSTGAKSPCENTSDTVLIRINNVSCKGVFPWNGHNKE